MFPYEMAAYKSITLCNLKQYVISVFFLSYKMSLLYKCRRYIHARPHVASYTEQGLSE